MVLIHTALLCEAQSFIEHYKLQKINSSPKMYTNDTIVVCISGVGEENTTKSLNYIFQNFTIQKAFNIGIAGCNKTNIAIGTLYCTNQKLQEIPFINLITQEMVTTTSTLDKPTLYDMEARHFYTIVSQHLQKEKIYIFKIVSDYLSAVQLKKDFVKALIAKQTIIHQFINLN